ncbi:hypothetical protein GCM10027423_06010 [Spirosoma arcticum]
MTRKGVPKRRITVTSHWNVGYSAHSQATGSAGSNKDAGGSLNHYHEIQNRFILIQSRIDPRRRIVAFGK